MRVRKDNSYKHVVLTQYENIPLYKLDSKIFVSIFKLSAYYINKQ